MDFYGTFNQRRELGQRPTVPVDFVHELLAATSTHTPLAQGPWDSLPAAHCHPSDGGREPRPPSFSAEVTSTKKAHCSERSQHPSSHCLSRELVSPVQPGGRWQCRAALTIAGEAASPHRPCACAQRELTVRGEDLISSGPTGSRYRDVLEAWAPQSDLLGEPGRQALLVRDPASGEQLHRNALPTSKQRQSTELSTLTLQPQDHCPDDAPSPRKLVKLAQNL